MSQGAKKINFLLLFATTPESHFHWPENNFSQAFFNNYLLAPSDM